ncbi:hypothetical protein [Streptomyces sp. NPDC055109]
MNDSEHMPPHDTSRSTAVAHTAKDKASEAVDHVGSNASEVVDTAKEQAAQTVSEASAQGRDLLVELREQLYGQSRAQAEQLAGHVRNLADELHQMSDSGTPGSTASAAVRQIADGGHKVATHLETRGPDGIVEDLRGFARRKPGLFLAGAALAGFATARLGKGIAAADSPAPSASHQSPSGSSSVSDEVPASGTGELDSSGVPPHGNPAPGAGVGTPSSGVPVSVPGMAEEGVGLSTNSTAPEVPVHRPQGI